VQAARRQAGGRGAPPGAAPDTSHGEARVTGTRDVKTASSRRARDALEMPPLTPKLPLATTAANGREGWKSVIRWSDEKS